LYVSFAAEPAAICALHDEEGGKRVRKGTKNGQQLPPGTSQDDTSPPRAKENFPVVGIGASAGGLEALGKFLGSVPPQSGMAFVIIQHLDPTHKGIMPELLQRVTSMGVIQARDRMKVEPDSVYVIPPNKDMSILHGVLHLFNPVAPRGLRLPIDFFFRSLSDDMREKSVGVILSGMGSDGTTGLRAIKEKAGLTLVQDPASAKFDSMPRSAINAGMADMVAKAEELPGKIAAYFAHTLIVKPGLSLEPTAKSTLEKVIILLRNHSGHDFSLYKKNTLYRRIERRMGIHQIDKIASYVRFLQENPQEMELLFKELLIGVTGFFRDPEAWKELKDRVMPGLLGALPEGKVLRAWVVGCSTGEEAYSLAITLKEALDEAKAARRFPFQIFATDLDRGAIDKARQGFFPANIVADVSTDRLSRFFLKDENGYRVRKEIRDTVIFAEQNVIMDPPFTKLDMITCRNLLIYLSPEAQKSIMPLFHYSLNAGGILFLGNAETVGTFTDLFVPIDARTRLYRKIGSVTRPESIQFPSSFVQPRVDDRFERELVKQPAVNLQVLADRLLLERYAPSAVLTNDKGDILYVSGKTGKYLELPAGKVNWNIFAMTREGLRYELSAAFRRALLQEERVVLRGLKAQGNGGSSQAVDLIIEAIQKPPELRGLVLTIFADVPSLPAVTAPAGKKNRAACGAKEVNMAQALLEASEELQSTREEMQASLEEAKSANEELQSANEELQSMNEELTSSKEELQSLNEELQTVNAELQAKVDALSRVENDWENLLNSTNIATLFLDNQLRVRRFTTQTTNLIKLIPGDVDRPITDLAIDLDYPELAQDARKVLQTLILMEKEVATRDGRWFSTRIMPYRTRDNRIDGAVITFTDITAPKMLEARLRDALQIQTGKDDGQRKE
jgi:two-component system, chemotaxis family, CheB/CheR fusion protein